MRRFLLSLLFFILLLPAFGFQWPVADVVLVSNFGESEFDHYLKGIDIAGKVQDVYPVEEGELVFYASEDASPLSLTSGLGSYVILQHKNGIRTLYGHLEDGSVQGEDLKVTPEDIIGRMGTSGNASEPSLHIQVIDTEFEKYVNPLLSFPLLEDDSIPVIENLFLNTESGKDVLTDNSLIHSGVYGISASIYDLSEKAGYFCPLAPFSISLYINGENLANFNFESLKEEDGEIFLEGDNSRISYSSFYRGKKEYFLGEFELNQGDVIVELSVKDFSGNEGVRIISLKVQE